MKYLTALLLLIAAATPVFAQHGSNSESPDEIPHTEEPSASDEDEKSAVEKWEDGDHKIETSLGDFTIGGYASFYHKTIDKYNGGDSTNFFDAHRIVPQFHWQIVEWLHFGMELEIEGGGADVSFLGGNEILIEYAEVHATVMDEFNVKAGILLIPFGRYNLEHDDILWDLMDRPFAARRVVPSAFDQPGVGIYGTVNEVPLFGFSYDVQVTQGFDDGFSNNGGSRGARQSFRSDNNDNKALWARFGILPQFDEMGADFMSGDIGISTGYQKISATNGESTRHFGIDGQMKFKKMLDLFAIDVTGEWNRIWINRDSSASVTNGLEGYFVDVLVKFDIFPEEWKGDIFGKDPYLGLIMRLEENDLNDDHVGVAARDNRVGFTGWLCVLR
ncbi:MAG: hypothetical protein ACYTDT_08260 [Planctomycetota bacterium]